MHVDVDDVIWGDCSDCGGLVLNLYCFLEQYLKSIIILYKLARK